MEQEVNTKTICIMIQSAEKAGAVFERGLSKFIEEQKNLQSSNRQIKKSTKGTLQGGKTVRIKDLTKDGSQVEFVDMGKDSMKDFRRYARKYGVTYSMEKNKETNPPTYLMYFKAKDGVLINKAISSYVADRIKEADKEETIGEKLIEAKEKVSLQPEKIRNKEKVR